MFDMVEHVKMLAKTHSELLRIIVAEQKRHLTPALVDEYITKVEKLERDMISTLKKLGVT